MCVCTSAMLLQSAYFCMEALQRVGVVLLQEQQVLLRTVKLILQGHILGGHDDQLTYVHAHTHKHTLRQAANTGRGEG